MTFVTYFEIIFNSEYLLLQNLIAFNFSAQQKHTKMCYQ